MKCAKCGYLGLRERHTREICEAETPFRERCELPKETNITSGIACKRLEDTPLCFMQVKSFRRPSGISSSPSGQQPANTIDEYKKRIAALINEDHECAEFTEWQQGFTPKEHAEINLHKAIIEAQLARETADRNWRDAKLKEDRDWREKQANAEHQWRRRQAKRERDWRRQDARDAKVTLRWTVGVGIATLVVGAAATLGAVWLTKWIDGPQERQSPPLMTESP